MKDGHADIFREEAYELLGDLETSLLELEARPGDSDVIGRIFRAMHTIKGSGAMFGFDRIAAFTHEIETVYDLLRNGKITVSKELIDLTLSACDIIRKMLDATGPVDSGDEQAAGEVVAGMRTFAGQPDGIPGGSEDVDSVLPAGIEGARSASRKRTYRIRFRPDASIFASGTNPLLLLNELRELGECRIIAQTGEVPLLDAMDPEQCYLSWDAILSTDMGVDAIRDVFIFVEDSADIRIDVVDDGSPDGGFEECKKLGEILLERGDINLEELKEALKAQKKIGEVLIEKGIAPPEKVESALVEQDLVKEIRDRRMAADAASSIRVPSQRLDTLVNLVGELVTVQARLTQASMIRNDPELVSIAEEVERLTVELRDNAMTIRMVPIGSTFSKLKRLVRDLSRELGREIELTTDGAETELDKTMIERLGDPLMHIIRNSIDHGIEPPDVREAKGKPRKGRIHLAAVHSGDSVYIQISDDGAGLDAAAVRAKAVEKGLASPDADLTEREIFSLIFEPGFSTAREVTNVSGRGVGMDVVKRAIDGLRGSIDVNSHKDAGMTIVLQLPLTLAIIEGLLVRIGDDFYVLPLGMVEECIELTREDVVRAHGRNIANVRGSIVPYIRLREVFVFEGERPEREQVVIVVAEGQKVGFVVDHVIGEHQTVLKSLGRYYRDVEGVSGATILGDGTVALVLDVPRLIRGVEQEEVKMVHGAR